MSLAGGRRAGAAGLWWRLVCPQWLPESALLVARVPPPAVNAAFRSRELRQIGAWSTAAERSYSNDLRPAVLGRPQSRREAWQRQWRRLLETLAQRASENEPMGAHSAVRLPVSVHVPYSKKYPSLEDQKLLRAGFLGVPNSGKSLLTNVLVSAKVTAVSSKANTTAIPHLGAFVDGATQVVLHDLPGVVRIKDMRHEWQPSRVEAAWWAAADCDLALFIVDAERLLRGRDDGALDLARSLREGVNVGEGKVVLYHSTILVMNKCDLIRKDARADLQRLATNLTQEFRFMRCFMISALTGRGVQQLKDFLVSQASPKGWVLPPGAATDKDPASLAVELVRDKLYRRLNKELPYILQPVPKTCKLMQDGSLFIEQTLFVRRMHIKRIVVGARGEVIQGYVVARAQAELEKTLGRKVRLVVGVKVQK
eukprot:evm.model.scf_2920.3 EVM.evm.TU.scf_2920.3   scf_2920:10093-12574(-)